MQNINMIFGAPGCGKTTKLMDILEDELTTTEPNRIAFVSFTRKGSYEGRDRAIQKFGYKEEDFPYFRTIHSLAFRDLGLSKYEVISKKNYKEFSKAMGMNFVGYYTEDLISNDDKYLFYESLRKNNPDKASQVLSTLDYRKVKLVEANYTRYKNYVGIKDFDDMITEFIDKNVSLPVDIAFIDEAQDLTSLQWIFCSIAFRDCKKVYIAGDDDQAIYEWSGADIGKFLQFTGHSNITILDQSYRLKSNILEFSQKLTKKIVHRVDKKFNAVSEGGDIYFHNKLSDLHINNEQSYYFLSRNNYFLPKIRDFIMKKGLTYWYKSKYSINMNIANAIRRYENYRKGIDAEKLPNDLMLKEYLKPDYDLKNEWYLSFNLEEDEINYYRTLFKNKTDPKDCNVVINTIHGVKGGEADNVVLLLDITKNVDYAMYTNIESELRCLYVACTRARHNLHIVYSSGKYGYDNIIYGI